MRGRTDRNQSEIVAGLRKCGATVRSVANARDGIPDLVVGVMGRNYLLEVKDGNLPPSERKLTPAEERFHAEWKGQVAVVTSLDEALRACGLIDRVRRQVVE